MNLFYTCSYYGKPKYQAQYDLILDALEQHENLTLVSPEKGNYFDVLTPKELTKYNNDKERHYHAIRRNIERADAVVIEVSYPDFQIGFEAAYAVDKKKYVLALSVHEDYSQKIIHPYFTAAKYDPNSIDEVIREFLSKADTKKYTQRFNFFLSESQLEKLNRNAQKLNLNQSEYLRLLIDSKHETS